MGKASDQLGHPRRNAPGLLVKHWTESHLKQTFMLLLVQLRRPSIYIIDALDQCDGGAESFISSFAVLSTATMSAKLLVLSRQGQASSELAFLFRRLVSLHLNDETGHEMAIATAIERKVGESCRKWCSPNLSGVIAKKLCQDAKGMYLLPMMIVDQLKKANPTPRNIDKVPNKLPSHSFEYLSTSLGQHRGMRPTPCRFGSSLGGVCDKAYGH